MLAAQEETARGSLMLIGLWGIEQVAELPCLSRHLSYGVAAGHITGEAIAEQQEIYMQKAAMAASKVAQRADLALLTRYADGKLAAWVNAGLRYGVEKGLYTRADIAAWQEEAIRTAAQRAISEVRENGLGRIGEQRKMAIARGVAEDLITHRDAVRAQFYYDTGRGILRSPANYNLR